MKVLIGGDDLALFIRKNTGCEIKNNSFGQFMGRMEREFPEMVQHDGEERAFSLWSDSSPVLPNIAWQYKVRVEFLSTLYSLALREYMRKS